MSFFTDILQDVQRGLRNEIPDQFAPTSPEGFEYNPTYQGTQYPADQPVEPRTIQSTPDYYGNTIPIDAYPDGLNPAREGGYKKYTNLPGRGDDYEFRPEAPVEAPVPGGFLPDTYELEDPKGEAIVTDPESYIRERGVQERHAAGLYNEVQAGLIAKAEGKDAPISVEERSRTERASFISKQMDAVVAQLKNALPDTPEYARLQGQLVTLSDQFKGLYRGGRGGDIREPYLPTPEEMAVVEKGARGARDQKEITSSADFVPTVSNEKKINDVISFITPDADLNVTAKRFIDAARNKGITMKSLGFSKASLREYGTFARWLNEYLINRPLRALGQHQIGLINERFPGN